MFPESVRCGINGVLTLTPNSRTPIADIREATRRGHALGDDRFIREMAARTGTRLRTGNSGPKTKGISDDGDPDATVASESLL